MEVSEFPRLLFYGGQASLAAKLIMIQKSQARLPSMPKQSFRAALGAGRAEAKLQPGPRQGESERRDCRVIQTRGKEETERFACWRSSHPSEGLDCNRK